MKIDNAHLFNLLKPPGSVRNPKTGKPARLNAAAEKFTIPVKPRVKSVPSPAEPEDLGRVLSADEKKMFDMLFSKTGAMDSAVPLKSYSIQKAQVQSDSRQPERILGSRLDVRG